MFTDDELLPISALQHLLFCPRQCALIHTEQQWQENRLTIEGRQLHEKADSKKAESRPGVRIARSLQLRSFTLGLYGIADIVEFRQPAATPFPVEYKRGKPKDSPVDKVQLCAQALCLEEMLNIAVPCGALYYGRTRHRLDVAFDDSLRCLTIQTARDLHTLLSSGCTPPALREDKCDHCSLLNICMPRGPRQPRSAAAFIAQAIAARTVPDGPEDSQ